MRVVALGEHFATPAFLDGPGRPLKQRAEASGGRLKALVAQLGDGRVAAMDAAKIDVQALSLTAPGVEQLEGEDAKSRRHGAGDDQLMIPLSAYLRENVHYTFSGFNFVPTFLDLLLEVGVARIMFSTDRPYQPMAEGSAFLDRLPVSGADRERIAHGNAERLFGV